MFEGSYSGDNNKIEATAQLECGICWWVYDPAAGDPLAYIPSGTPFTMLPEQWCCPNCDAPKYKFMVLTVMTTHHPEE
ncbi:Rubredoxin-type Fe(Cys)4 protein [mine drainage metagenome]|uniref:Rubredoxin-type Fe(Cys)4 protein n=1 Tax=mine drainage metagenome TaxID=410659 RepID=T1BY25_9ZZZZ